GLARVAAATVAGEERESQIGVRQRVAADEAAHAERLAGLSQRHRPEPVAVLYIARGGPARDVAAGVLERVHVAIADEAQPGGLVQELEDERRVLGRQLAQPQARRLVD